MKKDVQIDQNTILTFLFMGLLFLTYNLYMFFYNLVELKYIENSATARVALHLLNVIFYLC